MPTITEKTHAGEFLIDEQQGLGLMSRASGKLNAGQNLIAGTVLGRILTAGAAIFVGTVGTRGAVTVAAAIGPRTQVGVYSLICVTAVANAGTFQLRAPDGSLVPFDTAAVITVAGGAHTSDHLDITIADGATDFSVGDTYTITVAAGDFEILTPAATTGAQIATGILFGAVDATSADVPCVVITSRAKVSSALLTWPDAISDANKAIATAQLLARGVLIAS